MKGETLKSTLKGYGISNKELAKIMGLSEANLSQMLSKDDVRTGLVERISEVTGIPLAIFYGLPTATMSVNENQVAINNSQVNSAKLIDEVAAQRRLTETAMEQNSRLLRIIENMQLKH